MQRGANTERMCQCTPAGECGGSLTHTYDAASLYRINFLQAPVVYTNALTAHQRTVRADILIPSPECVSAVILKTCLTGEMKKRAARVRPKEGSRASTRLHV